jgi:hypothetical protein
MSKYHCSLFVVKVLINFKCFKPLIFGHVDFFFFNNINYDKVVNKQGFSIFVIKYVLYPVYFKCFNIVSISLKINHIRKVIKKIVEKICHFLFQIVITSVNFLFKNKLLNEYLSL